VSNSVVYIVATRNRGVWVPSPSAATEAGEQALSFKSKLLTTVCSVGVTNVFNSFNKLRYSKLITW
jgi:type III secretory pathway component EscS